MAYFSNGTEGDMYEAKYCARCFHRKTIEGVLGPYETCPVWEAHMEWNYEQCSEPHVKAILDLLIPPKGGGFNGQFPAQCAMFHERKEEEES